MLKKCYSSNSILLCQCVALSYYHKWVRWWMRGDKMSSMPLNAVIKKKWTDYQKNNNLNFMDLRVCWRKSCAVCCVGMWQFGLQSLANGCISFCFISFCRSYSNVWDTVRWGSTALQSQLRFHLFFIVSCISLSPRPLINWVARGCGYRWRRVG